VRIELRRVASAAGEIAFLDYEPRRVRRAMLVVGHGYSSSKHNLDFLCNFLASHGFGVLSLDFPGHKLGATGGVLATPHTLTDAVAAVVRFARETHPQSALYTCGHSMGATTALRAAAYDAGVAGAISIATGWGRPAALQALGGGARVDLRSAYVDGLSLPDLVAATEPVLESALPLLAGRPVLYVAASNDLMVSERSARELFDRAPEPKTFVTIDGDHTYAGENARGAVLKWLNERHPR
jgi:alpha-beta hydrolase superfamily lysophospholipase